MIAPSELPSPEGTTPSESPDSFALAEKAFAELKDQLRIGWDKVTFASLLNLETAIERCLDTPHLTIKQRLRVAMMFNALKAAWKGAVGTSTPRPEIERKLGKIEPPMWDGEFWELKKRADTLFQDLLACVRILSKQLRENLRHVFSFRR